MPATRNAHEVEATADAVGPLRRWIEELCRGKDVPPRRCADVALAVSEALSNVVMHAYVDRREPGAMRLTTRLVDRRLLVEIEDDGVGFRPRADSPGGGMGLALMAVLAEDLQLASGPGGRGAHVRMAFDLR
jgi:anti-sigma regulatory factor (Ser/Thr protein kinase)